MSSLSKFIALRPPARDDFLFSVCHAVLILTVTREEDADMDAV